MSSLKNNSSYLIPGACEFLNRGLSAQVYASSYKSALNPWRKWLVAPITFVSLLYPWTYLAMGIIITVHVVYSWVRLLLVTLLFQKPA